MIISKAMSAALISQRRIDVGEPMSMMQGCAEGSVEVVQEAKRRLMTDMRCAICAAAATIQGK